MDSPRTPGSILPLPDADLEILIALADGEAHGYAIMRAVAERRRGTAAGQTAGRSGERGPGRSRDLLGADPARDGRHRSGPGRAAGSRPVSFALSKTPRVPVSVRFNRRAYRRANASLRTTRESGVSVPTCPRGVTSGTLSVFAYLRFVHAKGRDAVVGEPREEDRGRKAGETGRGAGRKPP